MESQGRRANKSGERLENEIEEILIRNGWKYRKQVKFIGVYGNNCRMDIVVSFPINAAIECKRQMVAGSVDEKIPYTIHNLECFECNERILIMDGSHFKEKTGIREWAEKNKNVKTFNKDDFEEWVIATNIKMDRRKEEIT